MVIVVSDKKLFTIILYAAFANNEHLTTIRDIWKNPWITGTTAASVIGITGLLISPMILTAIIHGLGFGTGGIAANSFASWFMSLYGGYRGKIARGSLVVVLQSIGAAGLGNLGTSVTSGFGAAIGILIGAFGGAKLAKYFSEMELNKYERQTLESLIQIEEVAYQNKNMVIFTLMPALLYNDVLLKCFVETFMTCSSFANSELFQINLNEADLSKLKSEENVNNTIYNLLVSNYEKSGMQFIFYDDCIVAYNLDLSDHEPPNNLINLLVEVWKYINMDDSVEILRDEYQKVIVSAQKYFFQFNYLLSKHIINNITEFD